MDEGRLKQKVQTVIVSWFRHSDDRKVHRIFHD